MLDERPSKKQLEILEYIDTFIRENGFGPSYRETMRALNLKSPSTVASHVDNLIAKGFLEKRENSARSLRVIKRLVEVAADVSDEEHLAWLRREIKKREADEKLQHEVAALKVALDIFDAADKIQES